MTVTALRPTLTGKFVILLVCFLALQTLQLALGVVAVLHLGEQSGLVNETGKQRMRTYWLAGLARRAVDAGAWDDDLASQRDRALADYDGFFARIGAVDFVPLIHGPLGQPLEEARRTWVHELRPALRAIGGDVANAQARAALARVEALAPAQVARFDLITSAIAEDLRRDTFYLAAFQSTLLVASIVLGTIGLVMARRFVTLPMRRLIDAASAIAAGAYERRVPVVSRDELGELAETFNTMTAAIAEKTARISALNQVAVVVTASLSKEDALERILRHGMSLIGARAACIALHDAPTRSFKEWRCQGLAEDYARGIESELGGLAERSFTSGNYLTSSDRADALYPLSSVARAQGYKSLICLPLASHARLLGVIYFYRTDRDRFLPDEIDILLTFAHLAAGVLENAHLYAWMSEQAARDMLTGLYNRRTFEQRLREETQRAARYGKPYSLMLLDIDRFKDVNDTYGHPAGDTVLRALADLLRDKARDIDTVARYGGEEFAVIMPETDGQTALRVANRLRADIGALSIELAAEQAIRATVSIGVACFPHCADDAPSLVEHADQALYVAKHSGRNRASLYGDMLKTELEQNPGRMLDLLHQDLRNVNAIAVASDAKAESHHNHTQHVVDYAVRLGTSLGLDRVGLEILTYAAQLHDAGLMSVPDAVFRKSGPLTEMEWEWVRRHPVVMADILDQVPALAAVAPVVRHHHERYDGSGYPAGLKGEAIPYLARVLAVADAYAALIAHRPYRRARSPQEVCDMFEGMAGKAFDPAVVRVFVGLIRAELR